MKVTPRGNGIYCLSHERYSAALLQSTRVIPGLTGTGTSVVGSSDAINRAVHYLINERGLLTSGFQDIDLVAPPTWPTNEAWCDDRLRRYQQEAVGFLRTVKRGILADDMGLGKTASAINAACSFVTTKRTLIVCPSYVRGVWWNKHDGGELKKWLGDGLANALGEDNAVYECKGLKRQDIPYAAYPFVICHYDILSAHADALAASFDPEVVIFDEAHYLMNPETKRTKAAKQVSKDAAYVWGLTGTPMTNRPRDLWGILDTIVPGRFGDSEKGFFKFGLRYCDAHKEQVTPDKVVWKFDGKSNLPELSQRLSHFMLRRTKSQVALELPAKTRQVIRVDVGKVGTGALTHTGSIAGSANMRASLAVAADAKLKEAEEILRSHLDSGQKVVVTTYRRAVAEHLANALGGKVIHGGISQARREAILHELRNSESPPLLATTIDATSTGIDLSYADVGILVELTYEPHEILQWEARFHRLTTTSPKLIQYLIARGTTDELIAEVVLSKLDSLEQVVGGFAETGMRADLAESESDVMADLYRRLGL